MTSVNSAFKAYDIRGIVPEQLNNYFFKKLAISIEHWLKNEFSIKYPKIGVINDMRQDSKDFALSFLSGLRVSDATYFGMLPTDAAYFALNKYGLDLICIITASHNPQNYNGAKLFRKDFKTGGVIPITAESGLIEIAKLFTEYEPDSQNNEKAKTNKFIEINILEEYSNYILSFFDQNPKRTLNAGIDYGNGVAGIIDSYLDNAPINRTTIYKEPDGSFPNHIANPALPETLKDLQDLVVNNKLDIGLAFDGDGDRLGIIDENGDIVDGNQTGVLLIRQLLPNLNNKTVVLAITSSKNLEDEVIRLGGNVVYTKQGRFVPEKMKEIEAEIGLEPSCHYYLSCNFGLDGGLIAAVIVLNLLASSNISISKMLESNSNWLSSGELNFSVTDVNKVIEAVSSQFLEFNIDRLDGIRINSKSFWISLRSSNTEPLIRLNIESKSKEELDNLLKTVTKIIKSNEV